jgi:hypothetical protein
MPPQSATPPQQQYNQGLPPRKPSLLLRIRDRLGL